MGLKKALLDTIENIFLDLLVKRFGTCFIYGASCKSHKAAVISQGAVSLAVLF